MLISLKTLLAVFTSVAVVLAGSNAIASAQASSHSTTHTIAKKPAKKACKKFKDKKKKLKKCIKRHKKTQKTRPTPVPTPTLPAPTNPALTWVELYVDKAVMDKDGAYSIVPDSFDLPDTCVGDLALSATAPQPTRADVVYSPPLEYLLSTSTATLQVRRVGGSSQVQVDLNRANGWRSTATRDISNSRQFGGRFVLTVDSFYDDDGAHWSDYWYIEFSMSAQCTPGTTPRQL